jgi:hypothetical protein
MAYKARKTEHAGSKKGRGAYYGPKRDAKHESRRRRRRAPHKLVNADPPADSADSPPLARSSPGVIACER